MIRAQNKTFDEIAIGDEATLTRTLTHQDVQMFAMATGDMNPVHLDAAFAKSQHYDGVIGHSMWIGTLFSALMGMQLPGPGTRLIHQETQFLKPIHVGDTVTATVTAEKKMDDSKHIIFSLIAMTAKEIIMKGIAEVLAPTQKYTREYALPETITPTEKHGFEQILQSKTKGLAPLKVAVVHPVDALSLQGALDSAKAGIITPILIGPKYKIEAAAEACKASLKGFELISTEHSHAAAAQAVALASAGKVEALMKGKLATEELMQAVVQKDSGQRTGRRMSHVFALDVPSYPKPLFLTDAAINIAPTLMDKKDIVQNAVDLFRAVGMGTPYVAILCATEMVNEQMQSTLDATALSKMCDRGQITGAIVDGPLAFDNAISLESATIKGIKSEVAGKADILVAPDIESGNMLYKQLRYFSGAQGAGIVLGARVPIILTSRAGDSESRVASSMLAQLYVRAREQK